MRFQRHSKRKQSLFGGNNVFTYLSWALVLLSLIMVLFMYYEYGSELQAVTHSDSPSVVGDVKQVEKTSDGKNENSSSWCDKVNSARSELNEKLRISYPCEEMKPATSAVVCMLTAGVEDDKKATRIVFTARNYIEGAMALGESVRENIDPSQTHMLLLVREGFVLAPDDELRLKAVGWTIGTAPDFQLQQQYIPRFPRYKTTYTKVTAIGMAEYGCVMLMDADTLVVGDIKDLMTCKAFTQPQHRVGGTLDYYRKHWYFFNTGSILWRPSAEEMERVFELSRDEKFMKRFSSDQEFLNNVYPDRLNKPLNNEIIKGNLQDANKGPVVNLGWDYNAQTHTEVEIPDYWRENRPTVKIIHFTEKKGWQCEETHTEPVPWEEMPNPCPKEIPVCYCREAHRYWNALSKAKELGDQAMAAAKK